MEDEINEVKNLSLDDLNEGTGRFLKITEEPIVIEVEKYQKIVDDKYHLSKADFKYQIITADERYLDLTAWGLVRLVNNAFKTAGKIKGAVLKIWKEGHGKYSVKLMDGEEEISVEKINTEAEE